MQQTDQRNGAECGHDRVNCVNRETAGHAATDRDETMSDAVASDDAPFGDLDSVRVLTSVDSTNTYATSAVHDALSDLADDADVAQAVRGLFGVKGSHQPASERLPMSVALADTQTAGRGRLGRAWYNEPGESFIGSYVTAVPKALLDGGSSGWMTMAAGLAAIDAVEDAAGSRNNDGLSLKWPNDVFLGGKKLGGILAELAAVRGDTAIIVFGIGMNLFVSKDRLPIEQSTSLHLHVNDINDLPPYETLRNAIANGIAKSLRIRLTALANDTEHAAARLRDEVADRSWTLGRHVVAHLATDGTASGRTVEGTAESINADASLSIRLADGTLHTVTTGDVGVE